ncbi:MAG: cytochrome P450 [Jatrophihabitans sp.]
MRLPGADSNDPAALLSRLPDEALMPLKRNGLDPVPDLAAVRAKSPVSRLKLPLGLRGWLVTGYEESRTVLAADHSVFSNDFSNMVGKIGIAEEQDPGGLGFADPPAHTRLRRMLTAHFTTRALAQRTERIQQIIDESLDELERSVDADGRVDLQKHFSLPIPSRTIMELLGVDDTNRDEFQRLSEARFNWDGDAAGSFDPILESIELLKEVVRKQRVEPVPGLISHILAEYGDSVGDVELAGLADGVLTGGLETTVSMLTLGTVVLLQDRDTFESLRASERNAERGVEELLRYLTPVQVGFPRFAAKDSVLGGKEIFEGDVILCSLSGANRDERHGGDLDKVELNRSSAGHLAFGHGLHRCVGAELARLELRMAYPSLARRFPDLTLAAPHQSLGYRKLSFVYGVDALPVRLG